MRIQALSVLAVACGFAPASFAQQSIFERTLGPAAKADWSQFLADTSTGSISAAGMLGVPGDSITTIENVRDIVVAVKGLGSGESKPVFGISVTPARTSIVPMDLATYADSRAARLLGSLNFGYAQGNATLAGADYERRAVSIETNLFFRADDDPVVAYARAVEKGEGNCAVLQQAPPSGPPTSAPPTGGEGPAVPAEAPKADADEIRQRARACREATIKSLRWNRSQVSLTYATGWIKPAAGGRPEESLGRTAVAGLTYGFDGIKGVENRLAASITYRRTTDEPVLSTLQGPATIATDTSLAIFRLTGGSETIRVLAEVSNVESTQVTASQRTFKQALGLDIRLHEGTWLNLRIGKLRNIEGTADETGSLLSLSYSPTALLKPN